MCEVELEKLQKEVLDSKKHLRRVRTIASGQLTHTMNKKLKQVAKTNKETHRTSIINVSI